MERPVTFRDPFPIFVVQDLAASLRFYRDVLGFEPTYQFPEGQPEFVVVELSGAGIGLSQRTDHSAMVGGPLANTKEFEVCIYADDVDRAAEWLKEQGFAQLLPPTDQPWGERLTYFEDPDGNRIHVTAPKT
jgi:catechol 2,3-dioxygenase-like lactoylglutathione lyase family enzyme